MRSAGNSAAVFSDAIQNKALHELILYYLRERTTGNLGLTRLITCNIYEWYIFDTADFDRYFYSDKGLVRQFRDWEGNRLASADHRQPYIIRTAVTLLSRQ